MTGQLGLFDRPAAMPAPLAAVPSLPSAADTRDVAAWDAAWLASDVAVKTKHGRLSRNEFIGSAFRHVFRQWDAMGWFEDGDGPAWVDGLWCDGPKMSTVALLEQQLWCVGDALQALDNAAVKKFAFCQTPDFVCDWMLGRLLGLACDEFGAENVRVIDPTCGTGHFLVKALVELADRTAERLGLYPDEAVEHALPRVWGVDLNPCALRVARARMIVTAMQVACAYTLRPGDGLARLVEVHESDALLGMPLAGFHVVVGNPPYITEPDPKKRDEHRKRYASAHAKYSLGAVFTERFFQIAAPGGFVGMLTANSFMKREFGKALVEKVLPGLDLTHVINTSGAYLHGHGTPTVILLGRNRPPSSGRVHAVLAKRGEPKTPYVWDPIGRALGMVP